MDNQQIKQPAPKKRSGWAVFFGILLIFSVIGNIIMFLGVIGLAAAMTAGNISTGTYLEKTIAESTSKNKIAVINLDGMITSQLSQQIESQFRQATNDGNIKAIILKINSPGGGVSASDNINYQIQKFKKQTNIPVICYMDGLAASGGYYAAVACDKIIASPTTVTGSIGVIMQHFEVDRLLEEKLGIVPTSITSGEKKDWPSPFRAISPEEKAYLFERIIDPAYTRFVELVAEGRETTVEKILPLADGSIYWAHQALAKDLIDDVGYFDKAISYAVNLAEVDDAKIIEYRKAFSISELIGTQASMLKGFDAKAITELTTPKLMYLWKGSN